MNLTQQTMIILKLLQTKILITKQTCFLHQKI